MLGYRANQIDHNLNLNMNNQYLFQLGNLSNDRLFNGYYAHFNRKPVGVFWDIENCKVPRGFNNAHIIVNKIRTLFSQFNLTEREFVVVCDVFGISHNVINELNDMQVDIIHVCSYSKNASDEKLKQMIYRFVMIHGQHSAVILLSSDINFAPLLSDIKHRFGVFVILLHHRQVSPALVATANHHIDFDYFCSQIPVSFNTESDCAVTYLTISNWPGSYSEENARHFVNRITNNSGGRVIRFDHRNCNATVVFKCKSDAQRCLQRVDNRRVHGSTMRARINPNSMSQPAPVRLMPMRQIQAPRPLPIANNVEEPMAAQTHVVAVFPEPEGHQEAGQTEPIIISLRDKLKANRCEMCTHASLKISSHVNYLFNNDILAVHASLSTLSEKMDQLFESHSGQIPLNSLPNCWLAAFGHELDTSTEPKVMLEHLIASLPNVAIETLGVDVKGHAIAAKFIKKCCAKNKVPKLSRKRQKRVNILSSQIYSLIINNTTTSLISFPSILLSSLPSKLKETFNENFSLESFGVSSLVDLISLVACRFNLYSFGENDYLVALNFNEQLQCFIQDMRKALNAADPQALKSNNEVNIDMLLQLFKKYFDSDLNPAIYGVCYIEDFLDVIVRKPPVNGIENDRISSDPDMDGNEIEACIKIDREKLIPIIYNFLQSLPNWKIELKLFHQNLLSLLESSANLSHYGLTQFVRMFSSLKTNLFQVTSDSEGNHWIVLSPKMRQLELMKRLQQMFYLLGLLGDHHGADCDCMISFSIEHIYAQYLFRFHVHSYERDLYQTSSLSKVFERAVSSLYQSPTADGQSLFLVYSNNGVFLQKCNMHWIDEQVLFAFFVLFESPSYSLTWQQLSTSFRNKTGYSIGPSAIFHRRFREVFGLDQDNEDCRIKLCPLYEFAAMCLTVMFLHSNAFHGIEEIPLKEWSITQLEAEYYDHFGIALATPANFGYADFQSLFKRIGRLFVVIQLPSELQLCFKRPDLLKHIKYEQIPTCNYCEKSMTVLEDKGQSGDSGHVSDTVLSVPDGESDNEHSSDNVLHL